MSTTVLPGPRPASSPSGPSATALSAFVSVTITKVTSAAFATAPGESAHRRPLSSSHCAFDLVRLWPVTVCPFASSRSAVRPPIAPRPTYPRFAISVVETRTPCPAIAGRDSRGTNRKYSLEQRRGARQAGRKRKRGSWREQAESGEEGKERSPRKFRTEIHREQSPCPAVGAGPMGRHMDREEARRRMAGATERRSSA